MRIEIVKKIGNFKYPKTIFYNDSYYIFYIDPVSVNGKTKFNLKMVNYDLNFENILEERSYNFDYQSVLIHTIFYDDGYYVILEDKTERDNLMFAKTYLYRLNNKMDFEYVKDIDVNNNYLYYYFIDGTEIKSKVERDGNSFWGKYLFNFCQNFDYRPLFDFNVDYECDKGHMVHYIEKLDNEWDFNYDGEPYYRNYLMIFSIRRNDKYKLYSAYSEDLINFYDTKEIKIKGESEWYCYPNVIKNGDKYYVLLNQDDFGKNKETVVGELII